jgi:hypothetical protein
MVTYGVKFAYFVVNCQGQIRKEPPFAVMVYFADVGQISKGFIPQNMEAVVELKAPREAV